MPETFEIQSRFNGPLESGNGGYCSGVFAALVDGPAEVSLRSPVPLDTPLTPADAQDGSVRVLNGDVLVGEVRPAAPLELELPAPVSLEAAALATTHYGGATEGIFSKCFVCGRTREDSLGVFAGAVGGRQLVASPWTPPAWTADSSGRVREEFVWSVLDCPTVFATYIEEELGVIFLASMEARIDAPPNAGEEHVVIGWPIETDGRKRTAGAAVLSGDGARLGVARVLMIEPRPQAGGP